MRSVSLFACATPVIRAIPLFAGKPSHSPIPLECRSASARSGEGRPVRWAIILLAGLLSSTTVPASVLAEPAPAVRSSPRDPYADHIAEAAQRFELPAAWIRAVMRAESDGDPRSVSPKGAIGLMQIMPETWGELRLRYRLGDDPYDPHDNIVAGTAYIRELFDRYGSPGWIAAYNAGPGRYEASLKGRSLPDETRDYVATVAPNLDGGGAAEAGVVAAGGPPTWTHAPLFVVQRTSKPAADPVQVERPSADAPAKLASALPTAVPSSFLVRDVSAIVPQSGGLFVARAETGARP